MPFPRAGLSTNEPEIYPQSIQKEFRLVDCISHLA